MKKQPEREVYLDNSATTKQFAEVTEKMVDLMQGDYGNPSSLHHMGLVAEKHVKEARIQMASSIGASAEEIIFTSCGTEADNLAIRGAAIAAKRAGKKIVTTCIEHPAVLETFAGLEKEGFETIYLDVDSEGFLDRKQLEQVVDENTTLISLMHVNNEVGSIQPLEFAYEHKKNALLHSDCVQSFGKLAIPTGLLDMASFSAHKIHGPKGMGCLYAKKGTKLVTQMSGGGQERRMRSGTENVPGIAGFGLAAQMMSGKDAEKRVAGIAKMRDMLRQGICEEIPDVKINTPDHDAVCSILNVSFLGTRGEVLLHTLEQDGIYVSTGSACSSNSKKNGSHVLKAMGLTPKEIEGAVRFSLSEFTTEEDIAYTLDCLKTAVSRFRMLGTFR